MLRRVHLYEIKNTSFNIVKDYCYLMGKCIDKKEFYVVLVVFNVIIIAFQFMKRAFVILVGVKMTNCFVVVNV